MEPPRTEHSPSLLTEKSFSILTLVRLVFKNSLLFLSTLNSHPLFSILATFALLAFLYLPRPLFPFLFSPLIISTLLLLALLRHSPPPTPPPPEPPTIANELTPPPSGGPKPENNVEVQDHQKAIYCGALVDWSRRSGPLEVIYEEYDGEEEEDSPPEYSRWPQDANFGAAGSGSLSLCYSDSDTESSGSGGSPAAVLAAEGWGSQKFCFRWVDEEEEDDDDEEDELIEIALEEDNLIEIDISGAGDRRSSDAGDGGTR